MSEPFLTPAELSRGPDLLRPGSSTAHLGNGQTAFIYTKSEDPNGKRFFTAPASTGHEFMICEYNVLQALFGPDLDKIMDAISSCQDEYEQQGIKYVPTGNKKTYYDHGEIRRRSKDTNLYGRYGTVRGRSVLMLWHRNEGWEDMLDEVIKQLHVPNDSILTVGTEEIGTVANFKNQRS